jgi:hypothetical protein
MAYNAGGVMLSAGTSAARVTADGNISDEIRGVAPILVDVQGNLWVRKADTRNGAFAVYRDGELIELGKEIDLQEDADFYAGKGGVVYVRTSAGIQELKPAEGKAGRFVMGRLLLLEKAIKDCSFSKEFGAFYGVAREGNTDVLSIMPVPK